MNDDRQARFRSSFVYSGALCSILCEACDRVHFVTGRGHGDYEEGELEELQTEAADAPDRYVEHGLGESIDVAMIQGKQVVADCECGRAGSVAQFIEDHAVDVAEYLRLFVRDRRIDREREESVDQRIESGVADVSDEMRTK